MNTFKVTFTNGTSYTTNANGTVEQFKAYLMQDGGRVVEEDQLTGKETIYYIAKVEQIHPNDSKARALVASRSTYELIADWEESEKQTMSEAMPFMRGWIMDELEKRNPEAFNAWLDSCAVEGPRKFFCV